VHVTTTTNTTATTTTTTSRVVAAEALRESESGNKDTVRQVQELTLIRSELQSERDALQSELSEATDANRELGANLDAANAALQQMRQDMEARLMAAEEELENTRYVSLLLLLLLLLWRYLRSFSSVRVWF